MGVPTNRPPSPDRLEQLLALKRLERPSAEFWDQFDRELRNRRLAALVQYQSWPERCARFLGYLLRKSAPVGTAAAALVLGFFTIQSVSPPSSSPGLSTLPTDLSPVTSPTNMASPQLLAEDHNGTSDWRLASISSDQFRAEPHYVMDIWQNRETTQRSFVTLTSPKTLSTEAASGGVYVVNKLSSRAMASAVSTFSDF